MQVTSIFSFSHNVFFPSLYKFQVSITFILSSVNAFNLGRSRILSFGEELNIIQSINLSINQSVNHHAKCALKTKGAHGQSLFSPVLLSVIETQNHLPLG